MGEYSKAAIIKYTRQAVGMTQEELAETICEPETLSRYENGLLDPADDKFMRLMQKMGEKGDIFLFPLESSAAETEKAMTAMLYALERKDWDEANKIKHMFESSGELLLQYPENSQYIRRTEILMNYELKETGPEETIAQLHKILELTLGSHEPDYFPDKKILRETEILILFDIATLNGKAGNFDQALHIFQKLDTYFNRRDMVDDGKPRYLIYLGYSNLLGKHGYYDESIEICRKEIRRLIKNNKVNFLYNFYYNIGWNTIKKIRKGQEDIKKIPEAKMYIWLAYQLCKGYPENMNNLKRIKHFYDSI